MSRGPPDVRVICGLNTGIGVKGFSRKLLQGGAAAAAAGGGGGGTSSGSPPKRHPRNYPVHRLLLHVARPLKLNFPA